MTHELKYVCMREGGREGGGREGERERERGVGLHLMKGRWIEVQIS